MRTRRLSLRELPEQERPREKLMYRGEEILSDAELIAIILGSGTVKESALQLAQRMLKEAGDLRTLAAMSVHELMESFQGVGPARATQLKAALELSRRHSEVLLHHKPRFSNSRAVYQHFQAQFHGMEHEEFWVACLDAKNQLKGRHLISRGTLMASLVHPREVFHPAIKNSAAGIIVLHNHPSGDPEPSAEDRKVTGQIAEAGRVLGIPLLDHVIIGNNSYFSFRDTGIL